MDDAPVDVPVAEDSGGSEVGVLSDLPGSEPLELANEFAMDRVHRVDTPNGVRLEISSPHLGRMVRLCPLELESLTWQPPETFSGFLATPYGPEDAEVPVDAYEGAIARDPTEDVEGR